jgi:large subunit ribosomal protein L24
MTMRVHGKGQKRFLIRRAAGDTTSKERVILDVRRDDKVMVIRGDDKGKTGKVLRTIPYRRQVVVQNVNYVWRHLRRSRENPQGGRVHKEAPIPVAAVMVVCGACERPTRVYRKRDAADKKEQTGARFCKRCDKPLAAGKS